MKRSRPALALSLLLLCSAGCQSWENVLDENPVTKKAFWAGVVVGGVPVMVAAGPVTIPWAAASDECHSGALVFLPGIPTAILGGIALGLPTLILETLVRLPRRIYDHARGASYDSEACVPEACVPEACVPEGRNQDPRHPGSSKARSPRDLEGAPENGFSRAPAQRGGHLKDRVPVSRREGERLESEWPVPLPVKAE